MTPFYIKIEIFHNYDVLSNLSIPFIFVYQDKTE